jgi:2-polyprenyl-6-hydroxyphenyl methylase/3-demethylubiquinone-9 3-methyltransferase
MEDIEAISGYGYADARLNESHGYLLPAVLKLLDEHSGEKTKRVFEVGCGNGSVAQQLSQRGYDVTGVDPSIEGINQAHAAYPHLKLQRGSAYDNLAARYGTFPFVLSLEVVEHLYSPRDYAKNMYALLEPGGLAIISTPYHGYIKNLIMALTGTLDRHFTSLWDHGHIKFWSKKTLSILLREAGFTHIEFLRVGRIPVLAKSMIAVAKASR